jgi:hypothetical protein
MTDRKPFTKREAARLCGGAARIGHRPRTGWGLGDLPAPWAVGDLIAVTETNDRLSFAGPGLVCDVSSIDEGDAWYVYVASPDADPKYPWLHLRSGRLHLAWASRSTWDEDASWLSATLIETADPEGLALRERLLASGWSFFDATCPTCGGSGRIDPPPPPSDPLRETPDD